MSEPLFNSFEEAETKVRQQILDLCDSYIAAIKQILPTLKRASEEKKLNYDDKIKYSDIFQEASDHLHNLVQLKIELNELEEVTQNILLEISSEVLANAVKFLKSLPDTISKSAIYSKD